MALNVVRLPGFRRLITSATEDAVREVLSQNPRAGCRERQEAARVFGSADSQADAMVGRVGVLTGVLASMHWSLVEFERAWLITGASAGRVLAPQERIHHTRKASSHRRYLRNIGGPLHSATQTALLMTWHDDCDPSTTHAGTFEQACSLNMAVRSRAGRRMGVSTRHAPAVCQAALPSASDSRDLSRRHPRRHLTSDSVRRNRAEQWVKDGSYEKVHWLPRTLRQELQNPLCAGPT